MELETMQDYLKLLIKDVIAPIMKKNGFKKSSINFYKELDDLGWCLNVQSSRWNSVDDVEFTINVSIFVPSLYTIFYAQEIPKFPKEYEGIYRRRISQLMSQSEEWYRIRSKSDFDNLKERIKSQVEEFVLQYFNVINNMDTLIDKIKNSREPENPIFLAILLKLTDKESEAAKILRQLYLDNENTSYKEFVNEIALRLNIDINVGNA